MKRAALLYEYSRQNEALKTWIDELRKIDAFQGGFESLPEGDRNVIAQRIFRETDYIKPAELYFLTACFGFPNLPFETALPKIDPDLCRCLDGGAITDPLVNLAEIPEQAWNAFVPVFNASQPAVEGEQKAHLFIIPWKGSTNDDLAAQFKVWLEKNRPSQFPERKKMGRNSGRSAGANHKLNQLGAYRLHKAGFTREQARTAGFALYSVDRDWNKAISEAETRISRLYQRVERS